MLDRLGRGHAGLGAEVAGEIPRAHCRLGGQPLDRQPLVQPLTCPSDRLAAVLPRASVVSASARSMPAATPAGV